MQKNKSNPRTARLCFVGDIMPGRKISRALRANPGHDIWGRAQSLLVSCDGVIANLESPITEHGGRWREGMKAFRFAAIPEIGPALKDANISALTLANNHILDHEETGLRDTIELLDKLGINHCGAGKNLEEAWQPAWFHAGDACVSMISFTDNMPEFAAQPGKGGTAFMRVGEEPHQLALIEALIRNERRNGADCIILSLHWGINLRPGPSKRFRRFARQMISLGVDIVHGHSAHLLHGIELYQGGVILYDTGDFLDDYWIFPGIRTDRGGAFIIDLERGKPHRIEFHPIKQQRLATDLAEGAEAERILELVQRKSAALGTPLQRSGQKLVANLGGAWTTASSGDLFRLPPGASVLREDSK
jgi:poly-gamma-glutamate capsule biosynthesis protein CapA/YwtB (metallophosphatase superfamily)